MLWTPSLPRLSSSSNNNSNSSNSRVAPTLPECVLSVSLPNKDPLHLECTVKDRPESAKCSPRPFTTLPPSLHPSFSWTVAPLSPPFPDSTENSKNRSLSPPFHVIASPDEPDASSSVTPFPVLRSFAWLVKICLAADLSRVRKKGVPVSGVDDFER